MTTGHVLFSRCCRRPWAYALVLLMAVAASPGCADAPTTLDGTLRVPIADKIFLLELAMDDPSRYLGLSGRSHIPADAGMLFVFPQPRTLDFVMRRCLVPIDIIFLGPNGRVVATHQMNVEPPDTPEDRLRRYSSRWPAQFAIELKGHTLDTLGLKPGAKIDLPLDTLKRNAR